eukprot:scaffold651558_cov47-Prasinocladus_malaysianus.AAC.1
MPPNSESLAGQLVMDTIVAENAPGRCGVAVGSADGPGHGGAVDLPAGAVAGPSPPCQGQYSNQPTQATIS